MEITSSQKITKTILCDKIVELKGQYDKSDCNNKLLKSISEDVTTSIKMDSFRLLNVIFHQNNYNRMVDERAASLQNNNLDSGTKTGQLYFTLTWIMDGTCTPKLLNTIPSFIVLLIGLKLGLVLINISNNMKIIVIIKLSLVLTMFF